MKYQEVSYPICDPEIDEDERCVHFESRFKHVEIFSALDNRGNSELFDLREIDVSGIWYQVYAPFRISEKEEKLSVDMHNDGWLMLSHGDGKSIRIQRIESMSECRLGSVLVQFAIEKSIEAGFGGKVTLSSKEGSSLFYYKLGFVCRDPAIQKKVERAYWNNGDSPDGFEMYLPDEAIETWKQKIDELPILAHSRSAPSSKDSSSLLHS
jgi:hypothetical protein